MPDPTGGPRRDASGDPDVRMGAAELRARLRALPRAERRALAASVRSGLAAPSGADAGLALAMARRAQRNAQFGWLVFPLGGLVLLLLGLVGATGVVIASVVGAYLSTMVLARAVRAERLNRGLLLGIADEASAGPRPGAAARSRRLPVRRRAMGGTGEGEQQ